MMATQKRKSLKLVKYPAQSLTQSSKPIDKFDKGLSRFVLDMLAFINYETKYGEMRWGKLMGIAAPQVGKNIRLFMAMDDIYINPEITWRTSAPLDLFEEGCYSLSENKFNYRVRRCPSIRMKWQDLTGEWREERFNGKKAQVIQHELDHLDGKLCCGEDLKDSQKQNDSRRD
jgi:peptide deformylase